MTKKELLVLIKAYDGMEIHKDDWPLAEELVADGEISLSAARGPGREWRRAEALNVED